MPSLGPHQRVRHDPLDPPTVRLDLAKDPTSNDESLTEHLVLADISAKRRENSATSRPNTRRSALQLVVAGGILPLVSLATGPLLAYYLGPEGRGYLSAILAAVLLMPFVLAIGLTDAATYLVARRKQHAGTVAATVGAVQALTGLAGAALLWLLAPVIMSEYPPGIVLLQFSSLALIPMMALRSIGGARIGEGRYDLLVAEKWTVGLGRLAVLVVLAIGGALTVANATFTQIGVMVASQLVLLIGLARPKLRWRQLRALGGAAYSYGFKSWGGELSNVLIWRLDQVVLLPLAGAAQLGYYAVAVSLAEVPRMLVNDLRTILLSEVASTGDTHAAARACRMSVVALTVPVLIFMAITPYVLPLLFTEAFQPAVPMAEVLLLGTIPTGVSIFIAGSISALGRPGLQSRVRAVGVVVVVVGLVVLAPLLGGMGAALTTLAAALAVNVGLVLAFWRITGIGPLSILVPRPEDVRTLVGAVRRRRRKR
jgi:O-antigen/teichoic acid export membrane protein